MQDTLRDALGMGMSFGLSPFRTRSEEEISRFALFGPIEELFASNSGLINSALYKGLAPGSWKSGFRRFYGRI